MKEKKLLQKMGICLIAGIIWAALLLVLGNSGTFSWFPPVVVFSLAGFVLLVALLFPFIWQIKEVKSNPNMVLINSWLYAIIRYGLAFNIASFGWKKLLGLQFVVPSFIANKPMNQQSGEWLTWYYFGYSFKFGVTIALIQIGGACLILFGRTLLLGTLILFSLMLPLTLINIFYHMNAGALLQSVVISIGLLFLLLLDYKRLVQFFFTVQPAIPSLPVKYAFSKNWFRLSAIVLSLLFVFYLKWFAK